MKTVFYDLIEIHYTDREYARLTNVREGREVVEVNLLPVETGKSLSVEDIQAIRKDPRKIITIANAYGLSRHVIYDIKRRRTYKHIEDKE